MDGETTPNGATSSSEPCAICIHDIALGSLIRLSSCSHPFCVECIKSWATSKLTCPLCNRPFQEARHYNDALDASKCETITFSEPERQEPVRDFSCLDFDFYITLVGKLLVNIEDAEAALFTSTGVFSSRGGTNNTAAKRTLQIYRNRLDEILASLLAENHFNAEVLLDELVLMDENMKLLWSGQIPHGVLPEPLEDNYDDDYDDDDALEAEYQSPRERDRNQDFSVLSFPQRQRGPNSRSKRRG